MGSNERSIQDTRRAIVRTALMIAVLSAALGCRQQAATEAPDATKAPAQTKPEVATTPIVQDSTPPPAASEGAKQAAAALIGRKMPPYPQDLVDVQGVCVPGGEGLDHVCDYGLAVLGRGDLDAGTAQMLYLVGSRNADATADSPVWEVTDALDMPVADGYQLQMGECRADNEPDSTIVALSRHSGDKEITTDISWARRYDTASGKFQPIDTAKVSCVDPGYGL